MAVSSVWLFLWSMVARSLWRGDDARQRRTNCEGTRAVCVAAVAAGARRVVLTSSIAALGRREGRVDDATTSDAEGSNVAYQVTKRQSELIAKQVLELSATPLVVLRPGAVFGPFDIHTWSRTFVAVAAGKVNFAPPGEASFVHAEEVAKAHLAAAIAPVEKVAGRSFLLAGRNCTYAELFRYVTQNTSPCLAWRIIHCHPSTCVAAIVFACLPTDLRPRWCHHLPLENCTWRWARGGRISCVWRLRRSSPSRPC